MENNISNARREYADRAGKFTQQDAADYFGVSLSTYKKWEQGVGLLNGEMLRAIALKYGVSTDYLLKRTEVPRVIPTPELTQDERELLDVYRQVSQEERDLILNHAKLVLLHVRRA